MSSGEETSPLLRPLLESIAAHLGAPPRGRWRLELQFEDGRLREWWRHDGPLPAGALERELAAVMPPESAG